MGELKDMNDTKAWVVFSTHADLLWIHILKPGFRHCFVLINDGEGWLSLDPMLHHMDMKAHREVSNDFDLPEWLRGRGLTVIPAKLNRLKQVPAPVELMTCVSIIKRILGIHNIFIITPYQLYKYLNKQEKLMGSLTSRPKAPEEERQEQINEVSEMIRDPRYWRDKEPAFIAEVTKIFQTLYGTKP